MKILGLHYDFPFIRWACLEPKGKSYELLSLKSLPHSTSEDVKRLYIEESKDLVSTGISTLVRHLDFKIPSIKKIQQGLSFQIESLTSLPVEEIVYCSQIIPVKGGADATIFLASKEALRTHLEASNQFSILPDVVSAIPQALLKFAQFRCPTLVDGYVVHLGSAETLCIWFSKGVVKKTFVIEEGVETFLSSLWEDRKKVLFHNEVKGVAKQIDLLLLKTHLNPQLSTRLETFASKLNGVLHSFQQASGPQQVLFTGRTDTFVNMCPYLVKDTAELSLYHPPLPLNQDELTCAIAIGLAIEASPKNSRKIQFLKGDFIPAKQWRKAGRNGLMLLVASAALSLGLGYFGLKQLEERNASMSKSLTSIVGQIDKKLQVNLLNEGLEAGVSQALHAIQKYDKEPVFLLQAPTVSEVLAWISNSPLFTTLQKAGDPIELIGLKYNLVSMPKIGHARDPYQAKVEIQFGLKQSMSARKLHEDLLRGDYLVDSSQEITWEPLNDGYQASFYLKNRAPYVR